MSSFIDAHHLSSPVGETQKIVFYLSITSSIISVEHGWDIRANFKWQKKNWLQKGQLSQIYATSL